MCDEKRTTDDFTWSVLSEAIYRELCSEFCGCPLPVAGPFRSLYTGNRKPVLRHGGESSAGVERGQQDG